MPTPSSPLCPFTIQTYFSSPPHSTTNSTTADEHPTYTYTVHPQTPWLAMNHFRQFQCKYSPVAVSLFPQISKFAPTSPILLPNTYKTTKPIYFQSFYRNVSLHIHPDLISPSSHHLPPPPSLLKTTTSIPSRTFNLPKAPAPTPLTYKRQRPNPPPPLHYPPPPLYTPNHHQHTSHPIVPSPVSSRPHPRDPRPRPHPRLHPRLLLHLPLSHKTALQPGHGPGNSGPGGWGEWT